ncbi:ABC transporter permease [Sciscionella marina]|uniref:ABC transporter permease n=1 Tax=Sciscionella marina TaxID=508770 RepID=UPI00037FDE02|nr:ABC transporter permease [Sciscionella marina]
MAACVGQGVNGWFMAFVIGALNPLLGLLGQTLLTTPEPGSLPALGQMWTQMWHILVAVYGIIVLVAGILIMSFETMQARYTVKEIGPRIAVGFLAGALSLFVATKAIQMANALALAVTGSGVDPHTAAAAMALMILNAVTNGSWWLVFIALALVVMIVILLVTFIVRVMVTILLIAAAPIVLMWHALPHTEGIARMWWKAFGGVLAIQLGQSLALVTALRLFFAPGGVPLFGQSSGGLVHLLLCLALIWVLIKIPFWCLQPLRGGGRSMLGSLVRGAIAYKAMGLLGGKSRGKAKPRKRRPVQSDRGGRDGGVPADPPATRADQFMFPMRLRRTRHPLRRGERLSDRTSPVQPDRRPGPGQLSLFTPHGSGDKTRVDANPRALPLRDLPNALPRDQLGLPFPVRRDPDRVGRRSLADDLAARDRRGAEPVAQQGLLTPDGRVNRNARPPARMPNALIAPETGMLPIQLRPAAPRPSQTSLADELATPTPPPSPRQTGPGLITPSGQISRAARAPRKRTPDPYSGNRPLASGQYPLPLGVKRQPKPTPPPQSPPSQSPAKRTGSQLALPLDLPTRRNRKK